jgi:hypothetical protein
LIGSTRFETHIEGDVPTSVQKLLLLDSLLLSNEAVAKQRLEENILTSLSDRGMMRIMQSQNLSSVNNASGIKVT